jgi:hypothetical protein
MKKFILLIRFFLLVELVSYTYHFITLKISTVNEQNFINEMEGIMINNNTWYGQIFRLIII